MRERDDLASDGERTIEENIARLLRAADRPEVPSELALRRWRDGLHRALPAVAARARRRRRTASLARIAAAALILLGIASALPILRRGETLPIRASVAELGSRAEIRRAGSDAWRPLGERRALRPGDELRLDVGDPAGSLAVGRPGDGLFALERGAIRHEGDHLLLARGDGEWLAPEGRRGALATPLLLLRASDAGVRVRVREAETLPGEGNAMNARKLAVAGGTLAVIVTVAVLWTGDEPVEVERGDERVALEAGDAVEAHPGGGLAVQRGGETASAAPAGASDPALATETAASAASDESTESTREIALAVVDPNGAPVAGAAIAVDGTSIEEAASDETDAADAADPASHRGATTDAEGRALVRVPAEWDVARVSVTAPRHGAAMLPWTAEGDGIPAAGTEGDGASAAEPWTITLPFETAIAGRVIDRASGEPVGGALVAIQRDVGPQGWADPVVQGSDEPSGEFYFGGLVPGRYWVWGYKAGSVRTETQTFDVAEGQRVAGVELALAPGAVVRVSAFEKKTGLPVAGAVAYPHLDHLPGTVDTVHRGEPFDERVRNVARTGADGVAVVEDLPPRSTLIRVLHRGFRPVDVWVEPDLAAPTEIEVALEPGPGIRGEVLDPSGAPVSGTQVLAISMSLDSKRAELSMAPVQEGRYAIENVNPGMYIVLHGTFAADDDSMKMKFTTVPADTDAIVDFVELAELATLRGRITRSDGTAVARGFVTVSTLDDGGDVVFESSTTDDEGRFEIKNLALKEWAVGVSMSPEAMVTIGSVQLEQAIDYERDFSLSSGLVEGTVRDEDGQVATEVELLLFSVDEEGDLGWMGRSEVDREGGFSFPGVAPGKYRLFLQGLTVRQEFSADFVLAEGAAERVDMTARPGGTVRVVVVDGTGQPVPDLGVRIVDAAGQPRNEGLPARTGAEGEYSFPSLGPGEYTVQLRRGTEVLPVEKLFTAKPGETVEVRIALP